MIATGPEDDRLYRITELGVLAVAVVQDVRHAAPMAQALLDGGLPCVEVTLRTPVALEVLRELAGDDRLRLGVGSVTSLGQLEAALAAGATFVVTPGLSPAIVRECARLDVVVVPGVATPTEMQMACDHGLDVVKFFPAETLGGPAALAAMTAPYPQLRLVPTGGIDASTMRGYLKNPAVLAVGGSWMVAPGLLAAGDGTTIAALAREAVALGRRERT